MSVYGDFRRVASADSLKSEKFWSEPKLPLNPSRDGPLATAPTPAIDLTFADVWGYQDRVCQASGRRKHRPRQPHAIRAAEEVDHTRRVLATQRRPHRETSCSRSRPDPNQAAKPPIAPASTDHVDACAILAVSASTGHEAGESMRSTSMPCMESCQSGRMLTCGDQRNHPRRLERKRAHPPTMQCAGRAAGAQRCARGKQKSSTR